MIHHRFRWFPLLLMWSLLICARDVLAIPLDISGIVFEDANANGRQDGNENGISQVILSDGIQVVQTDRQGRYHLSTERSRVLFVSLPGEYLPIGDFFEHLWDHRSGDVLDFPLVKHPWSESLSFLFFTDSHVTPAEKFNAVAGMKAAVAHMNRQDAALVISGGDLIMDALHACEREARGQFALYEELVSTLRMPLFNAIGNHELYGLYLEGVGEDSCVVEEEDPLYGVGLYRELLGPDYYSFNYGPYHFVVLNTMGFTKVHNSKGDTVRVYYGTVDSLQLDWVRKDVQMVSDEMPIILVGHIPFLTATHAFEGYSDYQVINYLLDDPEASSYAHVVSNASQVINEVLAGRRVILALAGHHHNHEVIHWADSQHNATFVLGGSICGQWWQGDRRIAGSSWPEGYVLVHLKDGRLEDLEYISFNWEGYEE
jgi:Icc protein